MRDGGRAPRERAVRWRLSMASMAGRISPWRDSGGLSGKGAPLFQASMRRVCMAREADIWSAKNWRCPGAVAARTDASLAGSWMGRFEWNFAQATSGANARRFEASKRSWLSGEAQPAVRAAIRARIPTRPNAVGTVKVKSRGSRGCWLGAWRICGCLRGRCGGSRLGGRRSFGLCRCGWGRGLLGFRQLFL